MEVKEKKIVKPEKGSKATPKKKKSKITLFWEKYPEGIFKIVDMKAVMK